MQIMPFTADPASEISVDLDDGNYVFDLQWNERMQGWTFDLTRSVDLAVLVVGAPLLIGQDVLAPYGLHVGALYVTDTAQSETDAGPDDLGDRVTVVYVTPAELDLLNGVTSSLNGPSTPPAPAPGPAGGGFTGATFPLIDLARHLDDSGTEVITAEFTVDFSALGALTLNVRAAFLASSQGGVATYRIRVGGTTGNTDGLVVATMTTASTAVVALPISGTFANGHAVSPVKITIQSAAPGVDASIDNFTGIVG